MDTIDIIGFMGWSALLYGIGRRIIDVRFERREAE
jgi:hypothetical protein